MRRCAVWTLPGALAAVLVAACGDSTPPSASQANDVLDSVSSETAHAAAPRAALPEAHSRIDALIDAWAAAQDGDTQQAIEDQIVAGGEPALLRVLERVMSDQPGGSAYLLGQFGDSAIEALLGVAGGGDEPGRTKALDALTEMVDQWREGPRGSAVCLALLPRLHDEERGNQVAWALRDARPAARAVAAELAKLWLEGPSDAASRAGDVLESIGPDASPAARLMLTAVSDLGRPAAAPANLEDESGASAAEDELRLRRQRASFATQVLRACGSQDPSLLDDVAKLLSSDQSPEVRIRAASLLETWGDAAAPAAPALIALLADPHEGIRETAWVSLASIPSKSDTAWTEFLAAHARGDSWAREKGAAQDLLAADPSFASRLAAFAPTLPAAEMATVFGSLVERRAPQAAALAPTLLAQSDPAVRRAALATWIGDGRSHAVPNDAARFLDDPDPSVRAEAARLLAVRRAGPVEKVRSVLVSSLQDGDLRSRCEAIGMLALIAKDDGAAFDAVVAALDACPEDEVRRAAVDALAEGTAEVQGEHAAAVAWLRNHFLAATRDDFILSSDERGTLPLLLRFVGGAEAVESAVTELLQTEGGPPNGIDFAVDAVIALGPRAAALRPILDGLRGRGPRHECAALDRAIASIDQDPDDRPDMGWQPRVGVATGRPRCQSSIGDPPRRRIVRRRPHRLDRCGSGREHCRH